MIFDEYSNYDTDYWDYERSRLWITALCVGFSIYLIEMCFLWPYLFGWYE